MGDKRAKEGKVKREAITKKHGRQNGKEEARDLVNTRGLEWGDSVEREERKSVHRLSTTKKNDQKKSGGERKERVDEGGKQKQKKKKGKKGAGSPQKQSEGGNILVAGGQ